MPTIKYIGPSNRWSEFSITGNPNIWMSGQQEYKSGAAYRSLMATGLFEVVKVGAQVDIDNGGNELAVFGDVRDSPVLIKRTGSVIAGSRINGRPNSTGATAYTMHGCFPCPFKFTHVQLVYESVAAFSSINAVVAASASKNNGYTPKNSANADVTSGTVVTFGTTDPNNLTNPGGGAATSAMPAAVSGSDASANVIAGRLFSDIISLPALERIDGGTNFLAMVRTYGLLGVPGSSISTINPSYATPSAGTIQAVEPDWAGGYQSGGDYTAANYATYNPPSFDWITPAGIRFFCETQVKTIASYGDSTMTGWATPPNDFGGWINGYVRRAVRQMLNKGKKVTHWNNAYQGKKTEFLENLIREVPILKPDIVVFHAWSINDGTSQGAFDTAWQRTIKVWATCAQSNVIAIVCTAMPANIATGAEDDRRIALNAKIRASGQRYFDTDLLMSDFAYPARLKSSLQTGDNTHENDAGHQVLADALEAYLNKLV